MNNDLKERFDQKWTPEPNSGCWLWLGATRTKNKDYGHMSWTVDGKLVTKSASRISWELHRGEIPAGMCILHKCDVPLCVNPDHLFIGTQRDNVIDAVRKGRQKNLLTGRKPRGRALSL